MQRILQLPSNKVLCNINSFEWHKYIIRWLFLVLWMHWGARRWNIKETIILYWDTNATHMIAIQLLTWCWFTSETSQILNIANTLACRTFHVTSMQQIGRDKNPIACTLFDVKVAFLMNFKVHLLFHEFWSVCVNSAIIYRSLQCTKETIDIFPTSNHWSFVRWNVH